MELLLDPKAWLIVVAFSVLGSIGNLALYQVGSQGVDAIYTLTISGLVLIILRRPPIRRLTRVGMGDGERSGDWRPWLGHPQRSSCGG